MSIGDNMAEETFKVNTEENTEDKSIKVEQDFDTPEEEAYRRYRPNSSTSAHSVEEYNRLVKESVERYIESNSQGNNPTQPASDSVLTGVWIYKSPGRNKEETYYISWGVVEDLILNLYILLNDTNYKSFGRSFKRYSKEKTTSSLRTKIKY